MARRRLSADAVRPGVFEVMPRGSGPHAAGTGAAQDLQTVLDFPEDTCWVPALQPSAGGGLYAGPDAGERRKLDALSTLRARHPERVHVAQVAMVRLLLERGRCTIDDVRAVLGLADGLPARWLGAVPGELRRAGIIRRAGFTETTRPVAHARPVSVWEPADAEAARAWLGVHADGAE